MSNPVSRIILQLVRDWFCTLFFSETKLLSNQGTKFYCTLLDSLTLFSSDSWQKFWVHEWWLEFPTRVAVRSWAATCPGEVLIRNPAVGISLVMRKATPSQSGKWEKITATFHFFLVTSFANIDLEDQW